MIYEPERAQFGESADTQMRYNSPKAFDIGDIATARCVRPTVGFVSTGDMPAASRGSGTLIKFGSVGGILTCAHVLHEMIDAREIGILCFPVRPSEFQSHRVDVSLIDHILMGSPDWSERGPDLGFLRLPEANLLALERLASVVDGEGQRKAIVDGIPDVPGKALICGVVDERTSPPRIEGTVATTAFEAFVNLGRLVNVPGADGMDLFQFRPDTVEGVILPKSYAGTSGGGLWQLYLRPDEEGGYTCVQARLCGVAFYQKPIGDELHIIGHGQRSIYGSLYGLVREKWPT